MLTTFTFKAEGLSPDTKEDATIYVQPFSPYPLPLILEAIKSNQKEAERLGQWIRDYLTGESRRIVIEKLTK